MTKEKLEGLMLAHGHSDDRKIDRVLTSSAENGVFAAVQFEDGTFAGIWTGHTDLFATREDLLAALNCHERSLLSNEHTS